MPQQKPQLKLQPKPQWKQQPPLRTMPPASLSTLSMPSFQSSQVKVPTLAQEAHQRTCPRRNAGGSDDAAITINHGSGQRLQASDGPCCLAPAIVELNANSEKKQNADLKEKN